MKKTIMLFGFSAQEASALKMAVLPQGYRIMTPQGDELHLPLGCLLGIEERPEQITGDGAEPGKLILLAGVGSEDMDRLLPALRKAGAGREIPKAVLTETNKDWTACELYAEIMREHRAMNK